MNGELIVLVGEAIVNLAVSAEIGVLGDYPEYAAMQRRVLRHGGLVLGRIEQRIEIVGVEDRHHHRGVGVARDDAVPTVSSAGRGAHLEHVAILTLAIQHIDVAGPRPYEEEAKVADRALLRLEELVAVTAHDTELDVDVAVDGREPDAHPLVGNDVRFADRVLGDGDVVERPSEAEVERGRGQVRGTVQGDGRRRRDRRRG